MTLVHKTRVQFAFVVVMLSNVIVVSAIWTHELYPLIDDNIGFFLFALKYMFYYNVTK